MKRTCYLLIPVWFLMVGCVTLPGGMKTPAKEDSPSLKAPPTPAPEPVNPDEVTSKNLRLKASDLEAEIRYDERSK